MPAHASARLLNAACMLMLLLPPDPDLFRHHLRSLSTATRAHPWRLPCFLPCSCRLRHAAKPCGHHPPGTSKPAGQLRPAMRPPDCSFGGRGRGRGRGVSPGWVASPLRVWPLGGSMRHPPARPPRRPRPCCRGRAPPWRGCCGRAAGPWPGCRQRSRPASAQSRTPDARRACQTNNTAKQEGWKGKLPVGFRVQAVGVGGVASRWARSRAGPSLRVQVQVQGHWAFLTALCHPDPGTRGNPRCSGTLSTQPPLPIHDQQSSPCPSPCRRHPQVLPPPACLYPPPPTHTHAYRTTPLPGALPHLDGHDGKVLGARHVRDAERVPHHGVGAHQGMVLHGRGGGWTGTVAVAGCGSYGPCCPDRTCVRRLGRGRHYVQCTHVYIYVYTCIVVHQCTMAYLQVRGAHAAQRAQAQALRHTGIASHPIPSYPTPQAVCVYRILAKHCARGTQWGVGTRSLSVSRRAGAGAPASSTRPGPGSACCPPRGRLGKGKQGKGMGAPAYDHETSVTLQMSQPASCMGRSNGCVAPLDDEPWVWLHCTALHCTGGAQGTIAGSLVYYDMREVQLMSVSRPRRCQAVCSLPPPTPT